MQIAYEKVLNPHGSSFSLIDKVAPGFDGVYHFHSEIEITLVTAGSGTRVVGDKLARFGPDDLVVLGENLPHQYASNPQDGRAFHRAKVIQFDEAFLGESFIGAPELGPVRRLFQRAKAGLKISGPTLEESKNLIEELFESEDFQRLLKLMELLNCLAHSKHIEPIASGVFDSRLSARESDKIDRALAFLLENFDRAITLEELSRHLHVSIPTCNRLLNKSVGKTFKSLLIEMRINHACLQLVDTDRPIIEIAQASGFSNLSNFNRRFKAVTNATPTSYRKQRRKM